LYTNIYQYILFLFSADGLLDKQEFEHYYTVVSIIHEPITYLRYPFNILIFMYYSVIV